MLFRSLVGRYGKHLTGSDVRTDGAELDSLEFDDETRELLGLDDISEIIGEIETPTDGPPAAEPDIKSAEEVIESIDTEDAIEREPE